MVPQTVGGGLEKIPEFLTYVKFGAEELKFVNEDDAYKIREPQDGNDAFEKSVITSLIDRYDEYIKDQYHR